MHVAKGSDVQLEAGDAGAWLESCVNSPAPDRLRVVFHTVAWQYFPEETRKKALLAMAAAPGPLVQLAMEADDGDDARISLTHWPEGQSEELGRADFHGRWIRWN